MGQGLTLVIVGAIFAFAIRLESKVIDLQMVGLILMLAGAAVMAWSRREVRHEHTVTRVDDGGDPSAPKRTLHETVIDRDIP